MKLVPLTTRWEEGTQQVIQGDTFGRTSQRSLEDIVQVSNRIDDAIVTAELWSRLKPHAP